MHNSIVRPPPDNQIAKLLQAFRYNLFIFATIPILAIAFIWQFIVWTKNRRILKHFNKFLLIYVLLLTIFGFIRNTDSFAFLASTVI